MRSARASLAPGWSAAPRPAILVPRLPRRQPTGVSFSRSAGEAVVGHLDDLATFSRAEGVAFARDLRRRLEDRAPQADAHNTFAFLLVDGLFGHEEQLAHALQEGLGDLPLIGGSAGDSMSFASTYIYRDGEFASGSAVLALFTTPLPYMEFKTQHFEPTDERLVVTEADPDERVVGEINGLPAAEEYARMLGVDPTRARPLTSPPRRSSSSSTATTTCARSRR